MAKLYWTKEIKSILNKKILGMTESLFDEKTTEEEVVNEVRKVRMYKKFVDEVIADMEQWDREDDELEAVRKAARNAEKNDAE